MTTNAPGTTLTASRGLADLYVPTRPAADEMTEPDGSLRPHWRSFVSMMDDLGREEVMSRWDHARRLIRENGITHNVYGDPLGLARPWNLDLVPLLLSQTEWTEVGEGLIQRARLMDALMADLYGPGRSVSQGLLPVELVYNNPGFLRSAHGILPPRRQWIHFYAADLVRHAPGQFLVLNDRTQAPSGAGYALENRIVVTRVLPNVFRQHNVLRLAPFFIAMRRTLASLAPANRDNPRVVLLTPGPYNETYFEHAYLARYLGYTLAQGNDLTVRDCRVYLKTLSGLQRVDVILRRVDDDFCDPLELYAHSFLGVPGLLQAVREGTVAVANAIGSGALQAPAFLPFLPGLCRQLLGEDLRLPSAPTWWCGDPDSLKYVRENLLRLVIKPAFPTPGHHPVFGEELTHSQRQSVEAQILARPSEFVAQEHVTSFTAPVLLNDQVQARRFVLRAYLTASDGSYAVMPGGLTRVTGAPDSLVVSLQKGGGSKDTWILGQAPVSEISLLAPPSQPVELSRGGGDLPSRLADDLFWLGRYVQRGEAVVRLSRCIFNRLSDQNAVESPQALEVLMRELLGRRAPRAGLSAARDLAAELFATADPTGLRSSINHVHALARSLRDRISADAWQILRSIERDVADFNGEIDDDRIADVLALLSRLVAGFLAFGGMAADSMTRGQSWRFLDLGLRVERGLAAARLVRATLVDASVAGPSLLDAVLEVGDSALTYRRRYLTTLEVPAVVDLLLADETNPRSVAFQVAAIEEHLSGLPREFSHPQRSPDYQLAIKLRALLRLADLPAACRVEGGRRAGIAELAGEVIEHLASISELVSRTFFTHATGSRRLLSPGPEPLP